MLLSQTGEQTQLCSSPAMCTVLSAVLQASASLCPLPLVTFPSLGGLLHHRLLERLEGHMEDAHCSEWAVYLGGSGAGEGCGAVVEPSVCVGAAGAELGWVSRQGLFCHVLMVICFLFRFRGHCSSRYRDSRLRAWKQAQPSSTI